MSIPTNNCPGCGKDHRKEVLENMHEFALIERAISVVEDEHPEETPLSHSAVFLFRQLAGMAVEKTAHENIARGGGAIMEAVENAVCTMLMKVFLAGVATAHDLSDDLRIPNVHVTDALVQEKREWLEGIIKQADEMPDPSELMNSLREFLKQAGIDPEQVQVVGVGDAPAEVQDALKKQQGGEDTGHGMYL